MKSAFRLMVAILLFGAANIPSFAQFASETDVPPFHFPLEVGNVWVYRTSDFPNNCFPNNWCQHWSLEVVEVNQFEDRTCATILARRFYREYSTNESIPDQQSTTAMCQSGNRIYQYKDLLEVPAVFEERDMIADFDRSADQPWVVEIHQAHGSGPSYTLRR